MTTIPGGIGVEKRRTGAFAISSDGSGVEDSDREWWGPGSLGDWNGEISITTSQSAIFLFFCRFLSLSPVILWYRCST